MKIHKIKDSLLDLNNLRKIAGFSILGSSTGSNIKHIILESPAKGKVLVLAPHPDDDVIGCGGTMAKHIDQGDEVKVIYFSNKNTEREKEARKASQILGTSDIEFSDPQTLKKFDDFNIIYVPSFLDSNPDHFGLAVDFAKKIKKSPFSGEIYSYEVWTPIFANRLINIDKTFEKKIKALKCHASQLKDRNYIEATTGLAMYRAGMFNAGKYAEAFFCCNKELYLKIFDLISFKKS